MPYFLSCQPLYNEWTSHVIGYCISWCVVTSSFFFRFYNATMIAYWEMWVVTFNLLYKILALYVKPHCKSSISTYNNKSSIYRNQWSPIDWRQFDAWLNKLDNQGNCLKQHSIMLCKDCCDSSFVLRYLLLRGISPFSNNLLCIW